METLELLKLIKENKVSLEDALQELTLLGYCPNLLNDDNGHWTVNFGGFQSVPTGEDIEDVSTSFFIEKKAWFVDIREALIYGLEN